MARTVRWLLVTGTLGWVVFSAFPAGASETFPKVFVQRWGVRNVDALPVPGTKGCRLCHDDEIGGTQNVRTYFGLRIKNTYHVTKTRTDLLGRALDEIEEREDDSDFDGATDYEEIVEDQTNPNDPSDRRPPDVHSAGGAGGTDGEAGAPTLPPTTPPLLPELPPPIGHGCSLSAGGNDSVPILWMLGALGSALTLRKRRR